MSDQATALKLDESPSIIVFEDRPKQRMVFQMNLSVYLGANVRHVADEKDLAAMLKRKDRVDLIITRSEMRGEDYPKRILKVLEEAGVKIPVISIGAGSVEKDVVYLEDSDQVKPMLQNAARILKITAAQMAAMKMDEHFEVQATFLNMLFSLPCEIFMPDKAGGFKTLFKESEPIARGKVNILIKKNQRIYIKALKRLRFANAFTEQVLKAAEELASDNVTTEKKMELLSASVDIVAAQFQNSGMDAEIVNLAQASIKAIEKLADAAGNVGNLVKQLLAANGGYRYAHCQLITFLGFHVIKMMDWWGDDQRNIFSQAAFYHDISLTNDDEVRMHSLEDLKAKGVTDAAVIDLVLTHAQRAARELQNAPEINPEVIRVVMQHHGTKVGKGFSTDIGSLENLTKVFIVSEEWADYLISLADEGANANNEKKLAALKEKYKDPLTHQIIETLRYLDPDKFTMDFLEDATTISADPVEQEAETVVPGDAPEAEEEIVVSGGEEEAEITEYVISPEQEATLAKEEVIFAQAEAEYKTKETTWVQEAEQDAAEEKACEEELKSADPTTPEGKAKVEAVAAKRAAKKALVAARPPRPTPPKRPERPKPVPTKRKVPVASLKKVTRPVIKDGKPLMKEVDGKSVEVTEEVLVTADGLVANPVKKVTSRKVVKDDSAITLGAEVPGTEDGREVVHQDAVDEGSTQETRIKSSEGVADEDILNVAKGAVKQKSTRLEGVTYVRKDAIINVKGEKQGPESKQVMKGVTEVIKDEVHVIKGDPKAPESYVSRSFAAEEKKDGAELKMKALSGVTEFMTMALQGDLAKVEEFIKGPTFLVELKKTDAEGRTVLHFAAMGGSVPVLKLLLEKGAQKSLVDSKRRSALYLAALHKKNEAFDFLLAQGSQAKQQAMGGMTIAMVAAFSGNLHILKEVMKAGVRLDTADHTGKKALDYAKLGKNAEVISFIESGAKP